MTHQPIPTGELEAMKARCEAASVGPWSDDVVDFKDCEALKFGTSWLYMRDENQSVYEGCAEDGVEITGCDCLGECKASQRDDLRFIAHARTDLPRCIAEIERLQSGGRWKYPHMCQDGHPQIGHSDSEHEQCPLCRALSDVEVARGALEGICGRDVPSGIPSYMPVEVAEEALSKLSPKSQ